MKSSNADLFERAALGLFAPLAADANVEFRRICDGVYELAGAEFVMRVRRGTGHQKDILITLLPTLNRPAMNDDLSGEIGLGVVAEFQGERLPDFAMETEEDYMRSAGTLAAIATRMIVPFLRGDEVGFAKLRKYVDAKVANSRRQLPDYLRPGYWQLRQRD